MLIYELYKITRVRNAQINYLSSFPSSVLLLPLSIFLPFCGILLILFSPFFTFFLLSHSFSFIHVIISFILSFTLSPSLSSLLFPSLLFSSLPFSSLFFFHSLFMQVQNIKYLLIPAIFLNYLILSK